MPELIYLSRLSYYTASVLKKSCRTYTVARVTLFKKELMF